MRMAIALLLILPAFGEPPADDFRISTDVYNVVLDVGVRNSKGRYVSGLPAEDFRVEDIGVPQKITSFSDGDVPVTVGLVMDDSGSMRPKRADVITAGLAFAGASNPKDEIFVVNFNDSVHFGLPPSLPFSDNIKTLAAALAKDQPAGRTALYAAIAHALQHLEMGTRDRKTLVAISDGGDNASAEKLSEIVHMIEESHATIYTIGLFDADDSDRNPRVLQRLASISGGEAFLPAKLDDVIPLCRKVAGDIRHRYTIGYVPSGNGSKEGRHTLRVTVSDPRYGHLTVQTRTSYITPPAVLDP